MDGLADDQHDDEKTLDSAPTSRTERQLNM
jgi:hypothetical protein